MLRKNRKSCLITILFFVALCTSTYGKAIYVDDDTAGTNDGSSWEDAYVYLQDALADANNAEKPVEIRVAQGIYKPDQGANQTSGDREATFQLINGVTLKGGYAGSGETDPNERDITLYETILSGDLAGDDLKVTDPRDLLNEPTRSENSYHIVTGSGTDSTAFLDGFTITGGNADSPIDSHGTGGGIRNQAGDSTIINCTFLGNSGTYAGGMDNDHCDPTVINCTFRMNAADFFGAGMGNLYAVPTVTNCKFIGNVAFSGGGMDNVASDPKVNNCTFYGNSSTYQAAAIRNMGSTPVLSNCILWGDNPDELDSWEWPILPTHCNIQGGFSGEGNIDVDPLFANSGYWADVNDANMVVEPNDPNAMWIDGDYHLKSEAGRWDPVRESWIVDDVTSPCIDAGDPNMPVGDEPEPNGGRINIGAYGGTAQASMSPGTEQIVYVQWLGHSTVKIWTEDCIVYVDPQSLSISPHDAMFVLVTHTHGDHYSPSDIARVSNDQTQFIGPPDVVSQYGRGLSIAPWQTMEFDFVNIEAVPSYNTNKSNHPKSRNWLGYIIELGGKRVYVAGDTDLIEEMKMLGDINVAFLPAGGTYTMNATEAAEATEYIKPDLAIPYHWGRIVGTLRDAETFAELACCAVEILSSGETISSDNWPEYSPLIAHWPLDETEGDVAHDSAGENHGTLSGEPVWQPAGGKIDGALLLDGIDDYISTDFVLDPAKGSFSVFGWIKGDVPGQVIISQTDGTGSGETWLGAGPLDGKFMTGLVPPPDGRFVPQPLVSETVVIDDQWHHIGFAWDGSYRILYVDGLEVAKDTAPQNPLRSADGGMYIGAGKSLDAGSFFSGLIDDIRIYNIALTAEQIEELARRQ